MAHVILDTDKGDEEDESNFITEEVPVVDAMSQVCEAGGGWGGCEVWDGDEMGVWCDVYVWVLVCFGCSNHFLWHLCVMIASCGDRRH